MPTNKKGVNDSKNVANIIYGRTLEKKRMNENRARAEFRTHLLRTPPRSDALRHSGGASLLCTSATVTLYLDVELSSERRPGTEQKTSAGVAPMIPSLMFIMLCSRCRIPEGKNENESMVNLLPLKV